MKSKKFTGIIPPVLTIFNEDASFDQEGMGKLIDHLLDSDVDGLFFLGSSGEFTQMSAEERMEIAEFCVKYVNGRTKTLIGTGSNSTDEVIMLSKHSESIGADGIVVINPNYWGLSEGNLQKHYRDIAQAVDLPIILYNFPGVTGQDLTPDMIVTLVQENENIVGIKQTVDLLAPIRETILKVKEIRPDFVVLTGYDDHLLNNLCLGGDGAISASVNFAPELQVGIYKAFKKNDLLTAVALHQRLAYLPLMYKLDSPFVNVLKEAMVMRGLKISSHARRPAYPLDQGKKDELFQILSKAKLV
ncbi:dihydrodipicolinate synthase family protein [Bacillaceae bacterium IKA-2]|nr:dihydrodipicolinate synthase family protein [Bacillaceae bacterium IKA-2]